VLFLYILPNSLQTHRRW